MKLRHLVLLFGALAGAAGSYGQPSKDSLLKNIRQLYQQVNAEKSLQLISLNQQEFLGGNVNYDNGAELRGYFKGDTLCKMEIHIGLSFGIRKYDYYFSGGRVVFIYETERDFQMDTEGTMNYDTAVLGFEGRYYYDQGKLIKYLFKGTKRMEDNTPAGYIKELPDDSKKYMKLLRDRQKSKTRAAV